MNSNLTMWDGPVGVFIQKSMPEGRVSVNFGDWPASTCVTWFMSEADLDTLIDNLLSAKRKYIEDKHGQSA